MKRCQGDGFTLLELMLAMAVFAIFLLGVSQVLRQEIQSYHEDMRQEALEEKARAAMLQILDQCHLNAYKFYSYSGGTALSPPLGPDSGIYFYNIRPNSTTPGNGALVCLLDLNPSRDTNGKPILAPGTLLYFDQPNPKATGALMYGDNPATAHLVADDIELLMVTPDGNHFVKIDIVTKNLENQSFELVSWARLY
ncbi:prepilin-type N-terminal cleavage/methylation domain protein [Acididesulfobacillus acetoxydans]|uniref:IV_pilin_GFxxxE: prepilin-type N-terminal cleavage/methylation domain n=1 Tax=Acididesulfobacillus acetoxydans TaxID=1561005 RepID=A0A8S0XX95_9FIRM|nr:prepilin-type N-terminal cleavage/methylation domain-containing protein [Acididesulfobacillus acetoxydans]CAA7601567.1 prepilin-type N-terminal cleavage/methylation domain protein [Acididesulfobacillus acetoxydans]CEJ07054.1 IV_pilin_GFxxxE: prepilin-type N-terminal cleavage/methylation domain [Acididesulfobacillus acetoxydans]